MPCFNARKSSYSKYRDGGGSFPTFFTFKLDQPAQEGEGDVALSSWLLPSASHPNAQFYSPCLKTHLFNAVCLPAKGLEWSPHHPAAQSASTPLAVELVQAITDEGHSASVVGLISLIPQHRGVPTQRGRRWGMLEDTKEKGEQ